MHGVNTAIIRGEHPSVTVRRRYGIEKQRKVWHLPGLVPYTKMGVHNNSFVNLRRGLMERVYYVEGPGGSLIPPPAPDPGSFDRLGDFSERVVRYIGVTVPSSLTQVLEMYKGDRRHKVYAKAYESLLVKAVEAADARMTTFVKAEKINFGKKADPAPRVIQPRSPRYNLWLGQYLKKLEKKVYKAIQAVYEADFQTNGPIVCKGLTATTTAGVIASKWAGFVDPVAVGLDASRFDQHVSVDALRWEHAVYLSCYRGQHRADLARVLEWQIKNHGIARTATAVVKYRREGCRMSGDLNTSLGNCLIMCGLVHRYARDRQIRVDLANQGDDCVVVLERRDLAKFSRGLSEWFLSFGFNMKVEPPATCMEEIEFCQSRPVRCGDRWVMCRSLPALTKDVHSILPWDNGKMAYGWATAIADSGLAIASGMPVFESLYLKLREAGCGVVLGAHPLRDEGGLARLAKGEKARPMGVTDTARVSFWRAFGVPPYLQRILEASIQATSTSLITRGVKPQSSTYYTDLTVPPLQHIGR